VHVVAIFTDETRQPEKNLMNQLLAGQVAIITGGASGIGRATVELFVEHGARVVIADVNTEQGKLLADTLGVSTVFKQTDVANRGQVQELVDFTVEHFGGLHVMFNNAGISGAVHNRFLEDDLMDFERVIAVNLFGVMIGTQCAARYMASHGGGSIINTTSIAGLKPGLPLISYRAAKAGVIHATKSIATDLGEYGIRVNCIAPGHIPAGQTFYDMSEMIRRVQPLRRQGTTRDVANAALYLASELSAQVTGMVLPVDGGSNLGWSPK
jgi:NAD(P)-dependent dehydrogenase (short-subunit alcohol dehydrogenase family)